MAIRVFTAGVAVDAAKQAAEKFKGAGTAEIVPGGSVELVRKIKAGEKCDVFISADETIMEPMLMPDYISGYLVFASNRMVAAANEDRHISSENWKETLLDEKVTIGHMNPYGDPSGYRAMMAMMLADKVEPGLSKKLLEHPGHMGSSATHGLENLKDFDYIFTYGSLAVKQGLEHAILPAVMDLSSDEYEEVYNTVSFNVDENNTVTGSAINHAVAILNNTENRAEAESFVKLFLEQDLASFGFVPKNRTFGEFSL